MGKDKDAPKKMKVVVRPKAFCSMVLHAAKHKNQAVHGILLGSSSNDKTTLTVHDAVPVAHGTPTRPLIETAIGLIENLSSDNEDNIVGWYTAPMLLKDTRPGPVALRMAANFEMKMDEKSGEPKPQPSTLIVLQNTAIGPCLQGKSTDANDVVKAMGKDFGDQYLEPLETTVQDGEKACQAVQKAYNKSETCVVNDFVDHLNGPPSTPWFPNKDLNALVQKEC